MAPHFLKILNGCNLPKTGSSESLSHPPSTERRWEASDVELEVGYVLEERTNRNQKTPEFGPN
jgi:hypothetical protein